MDKEYVVCLYKEYYSAIKKKKIIPSAAAWVQLRMLILSEISQKEKDKYHTPLRWLLFSH